MPNLQRAVGSLSARPRDWRRGGASRRAGWDPLSCSRELRMAARLRDYLCPRGAARDESVGDASSLLRSTSGDGSTASAWSQTWQSTGPGPDSQSGHRLRGPSGTTPPAQPSAGRWAITSIVAPFGSRRIRRQSSSATATAVGRTRLAMRWGRRAINVVNRCARKSTRSTTSPAREQHAQIPARKPTKIHGGRLTPCLVASSGVRPAVFLPALAIRTRRWG
jgi:hypothetical protein